MSKTKCKEPCGSSKETQVFSIACTVDDEKLIVIENAGYKSSEKDYITIPAGNYLGKTDPEGKVTYLMLPKDESRE